jgi:hypothetical protein
MSLRVGETIVPVLAVALQHDYGASALAGLRWLPSPATQALCQQHGLLVRSDAHSLALYAPQRALPALWQAQREEGCDYLLAWQLDCTEPLFALASADAVPRQLLLRLALCSALDTDCDAWCARLNHTQALRLPARQCQWKYLLVGDWASLPASGQIEDLCLSATLSTTLSSAAGTAAALRFEREATQEALPDGRLAWVYRSPAPLPLAERSGHRIALSDGGSQPQRVLMGALAHASPRNVQRETRDGTTQWVSEIFLTR